jgi:hypothetical protein
MTGEEWASDYAHQITEVACIAKDKHDNIKLAIKFALGSLLGIVLASAIVQVVSLVNTSLSTNPAGAKPTGK